MNSVRSNRPSSAAPDVNQGLTKCGIMQQSDETIPKSIKITWGIGALGVAFMMNTVASLSLFYLISVLKFPPAVAGLVVFIPKLFDAVTDPIVGTWSDKLAKGKSRRRPFLIAGAVISSLSFLMIFTTPIFEAQIFTIAYVFTALMIFALGYTIFNIPYMAMPAEMTNDYHERSSIHSYRMIAVSAAGFIAGSGVALLLEILGRTDWSSYAVIGVLGALLIFATMMTAWLGTKNARFTEAPAVRPSMLKEMGHVFTNKHFIRLLLVKLCQLLGVAATISSLKYFVLNVITRDFADLAIYGVVIGIASIIAAPLVVRLSKSLGKSQSYILFTTIYVFVVASWILAQPNEPMTYILIRGAFLGVASTGSIIMAMSILTDIINYDSKITGVRREGVFTAFYSFTEKFTFALGPLLVSLALQFAGFSEDLSEAEKRSPEIRHAILLGMAYIPVLMGVLSIVILSGYKLKQSDIVEKKSE